jgi:hypothetical protein
VRKVAGGGGGEGGQGHLFRRIELVGGSRERKQGKEAVLRLCLAMPRPYGVEPDVWQVVPPPPRVCLCGT